MSDIYTTPYENPYTKVACAVGLAWVAYMGIRYAKHNDDTPHTRKNRTSLTATSIDNQVDKRNRAFGGKVPSNPDVPFFSRHNYNRRRRSKDFY